MPTLTELATAAAEAGNGPWVFEKLFSNTGKYRFVGTKNCGQMVIEEDKFNDISKAEKEACHIETTSPDTISLLVSGYRSLVACITTVKALSEEPGGLEALTKEQLLSRLADINLSSSAELVNNAFPE